MSDKLDIETVLEIIKSDKVNKRNLSGENPLHEACSQGQIELIKLLIEAKADVNSRDKYNGYTPLIHASFGGDLEIVKLLIKTGADVNVAASTTDDTALAIASFHGHTKVVKLLLESGADISVLNIFEKTALMIASEEGHSEIVDSLIKSGADVNTHDEDGRTALMMASLKGHAEVVDLLIESGAEVNASNDTGVALDRHLSNQILMAEAKIMILSPSSINKFSLAREFIEYMRNCDDEVYDNLPPTAMVVRIIAGVLLELEQLIKNEDLDKIKETIEENEAFIDIAKESVKNEESTEPIQVLGEFLVKISKFFA